MVLGIHDGHNASVAVLKDGQIVFAVQEERLNGVKNYFGFPYLAVQDALSYLGIAPSQIDLIAMASHHYPAPLSKDGMMEHYRLSSSPKAWARQVLKGTPAKHIHTHLRRTSRLAEVQKASLDAHRVSFIEHHTCHAAAAYWGSPWRDEKVLVLTCDGAGDELCATVNIAHPRGRLERIAQVNEGDSLGRLYATITFAMGMVPNEHEYKLMGLAPYAPENQAEQVFRKFEKLLEFNGDGLTWHRSKRLPHMFHALDYLNSLMHYHRFDCIAAGLQRFIEEFLIRWIQNCIRITGIRKVALGGGVFMNVKANKAIMELPEVEGLFIFPSCGDETNSIGAAFQAYADHKRQSGDVVNIPCLGPIYWGREFSNDEIGNALGSYSFSNKVRVQQPSDPEKEIAQLLVDGEIVARFNGRMEFGARALGNRSILANPANWDVIKIINEMIKQRDFWMPFAPSILGDFSTDYVLKPRPIRAPYMILCFDAVPDNVESMIAAIHPYDRTVRPQEVYQEWNPEYYRLIACYKELTGEGVILNTSFNLHGYPIVYRPADALRVFDASGLRYLAMGSFLVVKEGTG
jgi:carbamoyltransferase